MSLRSFSFRREAGVLILWQLLLVSVAAVAAVLPLPLSGAEPASAASRTEAYHVTLTNGNEIQIQVSVSAPSRVGTTQHGIAHHMQANRTCVFEAKDDFKWWQSTLDIACGRDRLSLRLESPSPADSQRSAAMVKLLVGDKLDVWTVFGEVPRDTEAEARARDDVRKLPSEFQKVLGDLTKTMMSPDFVAETATGASGFGLLGVLLDRKDLQTEVNAMRPLSVPEKEGLVRLAVDSK